jgi:hypothetical protein
MWLLLMYVCINNIWVEKTECTYCKHNITLAVSEWYNYRMFVFPFSCSSIIYKCFPMIIYQICNNSLKRNVALRLWNLFFVCNTRTWTQALHLEPLHQPFLWRGFFKIGSHELYSWAGFKPRSSWALPPEQLGLQVRATGALQDSEIFIHFWWECD